MAAPRAARPPADRRTYRRREPGGRPSRIRELLLAADSLSVFPRRGRPGLLAGTREMVAVSPYILVYRVDEDGVTILRIWHGAQDR